MLDHKTLYAIYLLHKASKLCLSLDDHAVSSLRLRGYLSGGITRSLDKDSLLNLLSDLGCALDALSLPRSLRAEFPRTLRQFGYGYKLWLSNLKSN